MSNRPVSRRLRILVFNPSYPPTACGVGDYNRGLAEALARAGHDVTVITAAQIPAVADGPARVLPLLRNWDVGSFLRAWRRFARPRPDLVVSGFPAVIRTSRSRLLYLLPGLTKVALGWPRTVFILHEYLRVPEIHRRVLPLAFRAADRIVTVSEADRDALVARHPSLAGRTVVRHNAPVIPVAPDDPSADARLRAKLAPESRPVIAFFGFVSAPDKGFEDLLEALARTDALLVVTVSLDLDNPYHAHVAALIERLALTDRVRWLGFLPEDEVGRLLHAVDAIVLPFRRSAHSSYTSLLAALANGAAVITTRGPQNPPWLRDGDTALLVDPCDPEGLARSIDSLLADDSLAARLRAGARRLSFGWDAIVEAVTTCEWNSPDAPDT
jgi:glycosyltransferase involved in cell wall biosynthesis